MSFEQVDVQAQLVGSDVIPLPLSGSQSDLDIKN
jgi:hypothetical protein